MTRRLSQVVEVEDVQEASRLLRAAIKDYATDPKTGRIDMDLILMGTASHERQLQEDLIRELGTLITNQEVSMVPYQKLLTDLNSQSTVVRIKRNQKKKRKEGILIIFCLFIF